MKKITLALVGLAILSSIFFIPVFAENSKTQEERIQDLEDIVDTLQERIEEMEDKIEDLEAIIEDEEVVSEEEPLKIRRHLWIGLRGEDVETLQEALSTDPEIYPEGLVTGYFGPLTQAAVRRFQKRAGFAQVGVVGPKTMARINEILEEGGAIDDIPPGLLIAPGIRKNFLPYAELELTEEQLESLPPGIRKKFDEDYFPGEEGEEEEEEDDTAPEISGVGTINTNASSTTVIWETDEDADSKVVYDTEIPIDEDEAEEVYDSDLVQDHEIDLVGLEAGTKYYFKVVSEDEAGNEAESEDYSFTTSD